MNITCSLVLLTAVVVQAKMFFAMHMPLVPTILGGRNVGAGAHLQAPPNSMLFSL